MTRNAGWLFAGRVLVQVLAFVLTVLLARELGEDDFGRFTIIVSIVYVGNVATTFGMDTLLIREVAADPRSSLPAAVLRAQMLLSLVYIVCVGGGAWLLNPQGVGRLMLIYTLCLLPLAFSTIYSAVLRAAERMDRYLMVTVSTALLQVGGVALLLGWGGSLNAIIGWLLVTQVLGTLLAGRLSRLTIPAVRPLRPTQYPVWAVLGKSLWLVILMVFSVIMQRFGVFALAILSDATAVGIFSAALRITDSFRVVPYAILGALFPRLARSPETRTPAWSTLIVVGGGLLGAIVIVVCAPLLIGVLYGDTYMLAVGPLRILALTIPLYGVTGLLDLRLVTTHREKSAAAAAGISMVAAGACMLALYPSYGVSGVCWSLVLGEGVRALVLKRTL